MEDRIRYLCELAVAEKDPAKLKRTLIELRDAIHQHIGRLRSKFVAYPAREERRERPQ